MPKDFKNNNSDFGAYWIVNHVINVKTMYFATS